MSTLSRLTRLALGLALLPPALAGDRPAPTVHLAPGAGAAAPEVRLYDAAPGARALLVERIAWPPEGDDAAPAGGTPWLERIVAVSRADPWGRAAFALSSDAFRARASLSVQVVGPRGREEVDALRLGPTPPVVPRAHTGQTREVLVTEIMKDPTAVSDARGEWLEVINLSGRPIDLEGWVLSDDGSDSTVLQNGGAGLVVQPYRYFVLGREADPALNGGVQVDGTYSGFTLSNGADEVILSRPDGYVSDEVRYLDGPTWPDVPGASLSLSPRAWLTALDDRPVAWCPGETALPGGDLGTPGRLNDTCGD